MTRPFDASDGPEFDKAFRCERLDEATQVPGIEAKPGAQVAEVCPPGTDLEEHARLAQGSIAAQEVIVQRPGSLGDEAIEAADLRRLLGGHCLTLVRQ